MPSGVCDRRAMAASKPRSRLEGGRCKTGSLGLSTDGIVVSTAGSKAEHDLAAAGVLHAGNDLAVRADTWGS